MPLLRHCVIYDCLHVLMTGQYFQFFTYLFLCVTGIYIFILAMLCFLILVLYSSVTGFVCCFLAGQVKAESVCLMAYILFCSNFVT